MHRGKWTVLLLYTDNWKLLINICCKVKINWVYRVIFGECDVELFQAEHQLELFFSHLHPHNSLMDLRICLQFYCLGSGEPHSVKILVISTQLQMLSVWVKHLLADILFYHSSFQKLVTLPFPSSPSFISMSSTFHFTFFGISWSLAELTFWNMYVL